MCCSFNCFQLYIFSEILIFHYLQSIVARIYILNIYIYRERITIWRAINYFLNLGKLVKTKTLFVV